MPDPTNNKAKALGFLNQLFRFSGRFTVKQYWLWILYLFIIQVVIIALAGATNSFDSVGSILFIGLEIALLVACYVNLFRRLHDLGLSGYWAFYLSCTGLPAIFCSYAMDADKSVGELVERIKKLGHIWGWILAFLLWPIGSLFGFLLVSFSKGQEKDNIYGKNPYAPVETAA